MAEASLTQPGQPALDPKVFEGETIGKDVTVKASVKTADGRDGRKDFGDHDRASRRRRPRRPPDYYEDNGVVIVEARYRGTSFELRVLGTKRLRSNRHELHDELLVVFEIFDTDHGSGPELGVRHARAWPQAGRLILFLIAEVLGRDLRIRIVVRFDP